LLPGVAVTLEAGRPEFQSDPDDPLSARLRARRRKLGLTITDAARLVGVRRWTFGMWENGQQRPSPHLNLAIAKFLGRDA
jgi:DNA-binding XRE family transcriptional regulator